jgi:hypothetical protein
MSETVKLWRISEFTEGPHWDAALVFAETEDAARAALSARLSGEDDRPSEVWSESVLPAEDWRVSEAPAEGVVFVLGAGCRG